MLKALWNRTHLLSFDNFWYYSENASCSCDICIGNGKVEVVGWVEF